MADLNNRVNVHMQEHNCGHGHCGGCQWWQGDTTAQADHDRVGLCLHEELAHFELEVSADSGCNRFQPEHAGVAAGTMAG